MPDKQPTLDERVDRLERAVFGEPEVAVGLMKRVMTIEEIVVRWQRMEWMMRGALVLMTAASVFNGWAVLKLFDLLPPIP